MTIVYKNHNSYPDSIIIRDFSGIITTVDIIASWEHLISNNLITESTKGIINNISNCNLIMNFESFDQLMTYMKKHKCLRQIKLGVVCTNSKMIVFPTIAQKTENKLKIKPFSSIEAAVQWIV